MPTPAPITGLVPEPQRSAASAAPLRAPVEIKPSAGRAGPGPTLLVPLKRIDFGKQPKNTTLQRVIQIRNVGKTELKIESVSPSWGCTAVDFPKSLAPGKAGSVKVKVDTGASPGEHTKSVTIKSNDPNQPSVLVELVFNVKS
jgi:uncharacterized protein DUF1573